MPITEEIRKKYKPTIGIECHVQLKTKTKLFAAVGNDARDAAPNTLISHICVGMPGALPVLNEEAVRLAARAAYALGTTPQKFSHFDRKHYFYPDLPKGYQITQYANPIIKGGQVDISVDGQKKSIGITRAHLEEDAGKNTHPNNADYSLVDLNRAGTPLLEIVSEPDISSPAEAKAFARELYLLMKYADVSDVDLYHGNMRFDVNVSVSTNDEFGKRTETKNLNSFRSVEAAVEYEINRQIELSEKGEEVVQETRGWDEAKQKTTSQRSKEEAEDYRYMPEPDVPPLELDDDMTNQIRSAMPILPKQIREELSKTSISKPSIEVLISDPISAMFVFRIFGKYGVVHAERIANWIINSYVELISDPFAITHQHPIDHESAVLLSEMVSKNEVSASAAKTIWITMVREGGKPDKIAEKLNLLQVSDETEIENIVKEVLGQNPQAAQDVKNGEDKAVGFLVGQVMKASGGKANPSIAQDLIKKQLGV